LALALGRLQRNPRWQKGGHRIVVAYRQRGYLCGVAEALLSGGQFFRYGHDELEPADFQDYARAFRRAGVALGGQAVPSDGEFEADLARQQPFIDAVARWPLLMHLLADALADSPEGELTAAGLLAGLIETQLDRGLHLHHLGEDLWLRLP